MDSAFDIHGWSSVQNIVGLDGTPSGVLPPFVCWKFINESSRDDHTSIIESQKMSSSDDDAGTLPMSERLTPCRSKRTQRIINRKPTQSASDNDATPAAGQLMQSGNDSDEEVPSTFPTVHPANKLDFEEDDDGDETFENPMESSSDEEDVSLAVVAKKSKARGKGMQNSTTIENTSASSSSDEEDDSHAVVAKKGKAAGRGAKQKTASKGGNTVRRSFPLCPVFIYVDTSFLLITNL